MEERSQLNLWWTNLFAFFSQLSDAGGGPWPAALGLRVGDRVERVRPRRRGHGEKE